MNEKKSPCHYIHFGMMVTGKAEQAHLPRLFQPLMATGMCNFEVKIWTLLWKISKETWKPSAIPKEI